MAYQYCNGDLLNQDDVDAIVNTVNCVGVMGKGIALQFKNKWPQNFKLYEAACKAHQVQPGKMGDQERLRVRLLSLRQRGDLPRQGESLPTGSAVNLQHARRDRPLGGYTRQIHQEN